MTLGPFTPRVPPSGGATSPLGLARHTPQVPPHGRRAARPWLPPFAGQPARRHCFGLDLLVRRTAGSMRDRPRSGEDLRITMPELISPELVLVDPELAARARAALPQSGRLARWSSDSFPEEEAPPASAGLAEQPADHDQPRPRAHPPARWPRSLRNAVFTFSACLNVLLVVMLASEERSASRAQHIAAIRRT